MLLYRRRKQLSELMAQGEHHKKQHAAMQADLEELRRCLRSSASCSDGDASTSMVPIDDKSFAKDSMVAPRHSASWQVQLEEMLDTEKRASAQSFATKNRLLSFREKRNSKKLKTGGSLREYAMLGANVIRTSHLTCFGLKCRMCRYIRHCYDGCAQATQMDLMQEELRRLIMMFAAAGRVDTTEWATLPPPIAL
jgi:hypothetical protein|eukprot:COSAG01_NODE_139_length_24311_cov_75.405873_24_plen_195_part_00